MGNISNTSGQSRRRAAEDTLEIQEVVVKYGFVLDHRDWEAFSQVFTEDASYEGQGAPGLANLVQYQRDGVHPYQHILANHVIEDVSQDEVIVWSKALFPTADDHVLEAEYRDVVVRTPDGWRIRHKSVTRYSTDSRWSNDDKPK